MGAKQKKILIVACLLIAIAAVIFAKQAKYHNDVSSLGTLADIDSSLPTFLELGSHSCIPCKLMVPVMKDLRTEYGDQLNVVFIDVYENEQAQKTYGFRVIPTQILYDANRVELFRHEGFFAKSDILNVFKELKINLDRGTEDEKK